MASDTELIDNGIYTPQTFSVDDLDEESVQGEEGEDGKSQEDEVVIEGKETTVEVKKDDTESTLRREISELKDEVLRLSSRKETPKETKKDDSEKLTRGQIVAILKEHKDDPEVLLNVIEHMAEQKGAALRDETLKDVSYRQWHGHLAGVSNQILDEDADGYLAANPKVKSGLDSYAENLGLKDHPVGKLAAYAIMRLSESAKAKPKEDVKESKVGEKKETLTNKGKMDKTRTFDKLDKNYGLTPEQLQVAKKFGVKPETYAKFVVRRK